MKILVTVKRVLDPEIKVRLKKDRSDVETEGVKFVINPFDEIAVEEGLRIKEKGEFGETEVVILSIGKEDSAEQIRQALAMGADRGILVKVDGFVDCYNIACIIAKIIEKESPDLILMGKQAVDDDSNEVGQILSYLTALPRACFASKIEIRNGGKRVLVTREVDGGLETLDLPLPAIITADLRLNEPRYPSLPGIIKAKKKPLDICTLSDLGIEVKNMVSIVSLEEPPMRKGGIKVPDVPTLVAKLKNEAKVL